MLVEMYNDREYMGIKHITMKTLPNIGYIAIINEQPVAAGFLRRVEGGFGQMDGFVSNPYLGKLIRHEGMTKVVNALLEDAKDLKLHGVLAFTSDEGIVKRAKELNFHVVPDIILAKPID